MGPGRLGSFEVDGQPGSELIGWTRDSGGGSYVQDVAWRPGSPTPAGVTLTQPGRPPIAVCEHRHPEQKPARIWEYLFWLMLLIVILLLLLLLVWRY